MFETKRGCYDSMKETKILNIWDKVNEWNEKPKCKDLWHNGHQTCFYKECESIEIYVNHVKNNYVL